MRLPKSVQQIADVIGRDKALRLVRQLPRCGSRPWRRNLYIPRRENLENAREKGLEWGGGRQLVELLGWEDALALADALGGRTVQPALCRYMDRALDNRQILALRDRALSVAEIAREVQMTEKWVAAIVEAREMYDDGIEVEVIAHSLKISPLTIGYLLGVDIDPALSEATVKHRGTPRERSPQLGLEL